VVGNSFVDVWGALEPESAEHGQAADRIREILSADALAAADPTHGRLLFGRTCMVCHQLYGEGGRIGPDITGANRANLDYLLGNILTPSAIIQDAYKMQLVLTEDGRLQSGIYAGENDRQLRLRVPGRDKPIVIAKSQIESQETAPVSMMPEGLLDPFTDDEIVDLVAYLMSARQVPLPSN
jgi:putative heme-binding domain-containing protein